MQYEFKIDNLDFVINWDLNTKDKTCTLCKKPLLAPSILELKNGIDGIIHVGTCDHAFHRLCIDNYLKINKCTVCYTDKLPWGVKQIINTGIMF